MKKLFAILLAAITCFSLFACNKEEKKEDGPAHDTVHEKTVKETEDYIVKDGKTEYKVVIPEKADVYERTAAEELVNLFFEATEIELQTITDENLTYDEKSEYFSIGRTSLIEKAEVVVDYKELSINGIRLYTKGKTVFMIGGTEYGVVYSVYEFLYQAFGFEQFHNDYYYIDTFIQDLKLMEYDVTDVPDIKRCIANIGYLVENATVRRRMRAAYEKDTLKASLKGCPADHATLYYLPIATYAEEHNGWFSDDKKQLCYTAHGDNAERELMINAFADSVKQAIKDSPGRPVVPVSNMDENVWCGCTACKKELAKYGTDSAVYIKFVNEVYDKIAEWFNTEEGKVYYSEDFRMVLLAYHKVLEAPVKIVNGTYQPIDDSVILRKGVLVEYAPSRADYTVPLNDSVNRADYNTFLGWSACANEMAVWIYSTNFKYLLLPYNTFNSMQFNYRLAANYNAQWIFDQSQYGQFGGATGWHVLKTYLNTKLAWDVNADIGKLIDHFFDYYFGIAAPEMREFFESYRAFTAYQEEELGYSRGNDSKYFEAENKKYWPKHVLETWEGYVDKAIEKISLLKESDKAQYDILYKHIVQERIFLDYALIEFYSSYYDADGLLSLKLSFKESVLLNKLTNKGMEVGGIAAYLSKLGV